MKVKVTLELDLACTDVEALRFVRRKPTMAEAQQLAEYMARALTQDEPVEFDSGHSFWAETLAGTNLLVGVRSVSLVAVEPAR